MEEKFKWQLGDSKLGAVKLTKENLHDYKTKHDLEQKLNT